MSTSTDLPESITIRPATPSDLADAIYLRQAQELAESGTTSTTLDQLHAEWETLGPHLPEQVWVAATTDGRLLASVEIIRSDPVLLLRFCIPPDRRGIGLESALLATAEQQARTMLRAEREHPFTLFAQATGSNPALQQVLLQAGFVTASTFEKMKVVLKEPPAVPQAIAGIALRPFVAGQDTDVIYRADEEAFADERGYAPRTFAQWGRRLNMRERTDELPVWIIAWDATQVAGAALGEVIGGVGWLHHVGVRRPWRKRGLGTALTLAALGAFYRQNIHAVRLNVDAESLTHAQVLYRRLGFQVLDTYANCEKVLSIE